jgi:hypothetical protein
VPGITTYALGLLLPDGVDRYVALFTTPPGPDGSGGVEVSTDGYARPSHGSWLTVQAGVVWTRSNSLAIEFVNFPLPVELGRIEAVGIYDQAVGGNLLLWALTTQLENISADDQVRFIAGQLTFSTVP